MLGGVDPVGELVDGVGDVIASVLQCGEDGGVAVAADSGPEFVERVEIGRLVVPCLAEGIGDGAQVVGVAHRDHAVQWWWQRHGDAAHQRGHCQALREQQPWVHGREWWWRTGAVGYGGGVGVPVIEGGRVDAHSDVAEQAHGPVDAVDECLHARVVRGVKPLGPVVNAGRAAKPTRHVEQVRQHLVQRVAGIDEALSGGVEVGGFDLDRDQRPTVGSAHRSHLPDRDVGPYGLRMVVVGGDHELMQVLQATM